MYLFVNVYIHIFILCCRALIFHALPIQNVPDGLDQVKILQTAGVWLANAWAFISWRAVDEWVGLALRSRQQWYGCQGLPQRPHLGKIARWGTATLRSSWVAILTVMKSLTNCCDGRWLTLYLQLLLESYLTNCSNKGCPAGQMINTRGFSCLHIKSLRQAQKFHQARSITQSKTVSWWFQSILLKLFVVTLILQLLEQTWSCSMQWSYGRNHGVLQCFILFGLVLRLFLCSCGWSML